MPAISAGTRHRLADLILADSQRAGLGPGSRLPTERQLALDMGATRSSVRHALAVLQAEGRISREVGRGTFLLDAPSRPPGNGAGGAGLDRSAPAGIVPVPPDGAGGFAPADMPAEAEQFVARAGLRVTGVMTMAPLVAVASRSLSTEYADEAVVLLRLRARCC